MSDSIKLVIEPIGGRALVLVVDEDTARSVQDKFVAGPYRPEEDLVISFEASDPGSLNPPFSVHILRRNVFSITAEPYRPTPARTGLDPRWCQSDTIRKS